MFHTAGPGKYVKYAAIIVIGFSLGFEQAAAQTDSPPSPEEMWRIIQMQARQLEDQSREIERLKEGQQRLESHQTQTVGRITETEEKVAETEQRVAQTEEQIVITAEAIEDVQTAGSTAPGWWQRTTVGGYGELHYEGGGKDEVDFHRFVLFVGHEFNDNIRFFSELEVEHAFIEDSDDGSSPGEVELEQAFIQMDLAEGHVLNAGVQLIPVGILNETHEPPTFFGVERNPVETNIIPSTWWEAALGLSGNFGESGLSYDLMLSSGLQTPVAGSNAFRVRSGRKKVGKAPAKSAAITGRLKYTGIPGVEMAASVQYQNDLTQDAGDPISGEDVSAILFTSHVDARIKGFGLRALFAGWWLDGATADQLGRDWQRGFYLEPSYRFPITVNSKILGDLGFFYRFSDWDNNAGQADIRSGVEQHQVGLNYWPHPNVVFKADYFWEDRDNGTEENRFNLGIGYQF